MSTQTSRVALGVDLGGTKIELLAMQSDGVERWRRRVPTPSAEYDATVRTIVELVAQAERDLVLADCGVGIGTPGSVTPVGVLKNCNSTYLNGRPFPRDIERALGRPVRVANDADCLALSEATDGAGAGAAVVFAAILGTGVGAGIAVEGRVLEGPNGLAGEWGHNPLPWATDDERPPQCYCGQRGCIESWLSGPALALDHFRATGTQLAADEIAALARRGDAACDATLARWESRLARALAHVINLLDPHVIVLGGGLSRIERLYPNVARLWARHVFSAGVDDPVRTRLVPARHGDSSGVRGAAWLCLRGPLLRSPSAPA